jgi:hypothetical protein
VIDLKLILKYIFIWLLVISVVLSFGCTANSFGEADTTLPIESTSVTPSTETFSEPETTVSNTEAPETTIVPETTIAPETTAAPEITTAEKMHSEFYLPSLSLDDAVRYFAEVCLDAEFVNSGDPTRLQKWSTPIFYMLFGTPTAEDIAVIEKMASFLNSIDGFPGISQTNDPNTANMKIHFCPSNEFSAIIGHNCDGNDGYVTFWYANDEIYDSVICIRNDIGQELRNSVIMEEIYNALGPIQDTSLRSDSIIYSGFSSPQEMTDVDMLILRLLYHPLLKCGMNAEECAKIISDLYY